MLFNFFPQTNTVQVDNPAATAWSTVWDTASAAGKSMPQQAVAANLVLTRSDTGSVQNGYTTAALAVSGAGLTVSVDGTALPLAQGVTYRLTLKNVAGAATWMLRQDVNAGTIVLPTAPSWSSAPVLATALTGVATSYTGTAGGTPAPTYSYQWTLDGVAISGATAATYTPVAGDVGHALRVVVTAINAGGSAVGTSNAVTVGGDVSLPLWAAKTSFLDDFAGIADNTLARTLSGWGAWDSTGAATVVAKSGNLKVIGGLLTFTGGDFVAGPGAVVIGRQVSSDATISARITALPTAGNYLRIVACASSTTNALYVDLTNIGGVVSTATLYTYVGATATNLGSIVLSTSLLGRALAANDTIKISVLGTTARVFINNILVLTRSTGAFTKGTICGFGTATGSGSVDDVYMAALTADVVVNTTNAFWPGSTSLGGRQVPLSGTYSGTVTALRARVVNAASGAVVSDWSAMSGVTASAGVWAGNAFVPMASLAVNPKYRIEVAAYDDKDAIANTASTTVGLGFALWGQSNSGGRAGASNPGTLNANSYGYNINTPSVSVQNGWQSIANATLYGGETLVDQLTVRTGVPCGALVIGKAAMPITGLISTSSELIADSSAVEPAKTAYGWLSYHASKSGLAGYVQQWLWTHGEAEASSTALMNQPGYLANFAQLLADLRALSVSPTAPVAVAIIGRYAAVPAQSTNWDANWSAMRALLASLPGQSAGVSIAHSFVGVPMVDDYHYTAAGYLEANRRAALSWTKLFDPSAPYDGRGPIINGATRSAAVITLSVNLNGATSLSGTGLTNYSVSTDDFATLQTISSVSVSGNTIVITLASDPGGPVKVRSFYGYDWGSAPVFAIGIYPDATTIPAEPIYAAITSN